MELKRPSEGPASAPKRFAEEPVGPVTLEDIEQFQKEAIFRQMKLYKLERDEVRSQYNTLNRGADESSIKVELDRVTSQYLETSKQLERLRSPAIKRCLQEPMKSEESAEVKQEDGKSEVSSAEVYQLEEELQGAKGVLEKQQLQLKASVERTASLEAQIRDLDRQLLSLPEEKLRNHDAYRVLEIKNKEANIHNTRLEQELRQQQDALGQLRGEKALYEQTIRDSYEQKRKTMDRRLEQLEGDLSRIRGIRDDLVGELNVKKAEEHGHKKQLDNLTEQIQMYEQRLAAAVRTDPPEVEGEFEGKSDAELREIAAKLAKQNKLLAAEIPSLEQAFAKAQAIASRKLADQAAVDAKVALLNTGKARADEKYFDAMRARDALNLEFTQVKAALSKSTEVIAELKTQEQKLVSNVTKLQRQIAESEAKIAQAQRAQAQTERRKVELDAELTAAKREAHKLQGQLSARDDDIIRERLAKQNMEQEIEKLRRQVEAKRMTSGLGSAEEIQEQIESLRSIALCSLCTKNWKDTAIRICGHVFCNDCAMERLNARMRKCPLCNSQFGQNDLLQVHL